MIFNFCKFNYYIVPELILDNNALIENILSKLKKFKNFSLDKDLNKDRSARIKNTEERILRELSKENNNINFNFLFFEKSNNAFKILLYLQEIAPTRLKYLIIPFLGLLIGCASGQLKTTEIENNEAIIIARVFINNNGEKINTKWNFLWNERLWGKNAVWVPK